MHGEQMNKFMAGIISALIVSSIIAGVHLKSQVEVIDSQVKQAFKEVDDVRAEMRDTFKDIKKDVRFIRDYIIRENR